MAKKKTTAGDASETGAAALAFLAGLWILGRARGEEAAAMSRAAGARRGWEHRREAAERVEVNVPPELVPLWRRTASKYKGTPHQRFERFMHDAHDDERAAIVALEAEAESHLARDLASLAARAAPAVAIAGNGEKLAGSTN